MRSIFVSKVSVNVKLGNSHGFERVVVYANVLKGRINGAIKCIKLNRVHVVIGNVDVGGGVEEA